MAASQEKKSISRFILSVAFFYHLLTDYMEYVLIIKQIDDYFIISESNIPFQGDSDNIHACYIMHSMSQDAVMNIQTNINFQIYI